MNKIASDAELTIQRHLSKLGYSLNVYPGQCLGRRFCQYGPKIKLGITPMGMVDVNFGTEFEHAYKSNKA